MRRILLTFILLMAAVMQHAAQTPDRPPLAEKDYSWMSGMRLSHPRLFLTEEDLPRIREAAATFEKRTFESMKSRVEKQIAIPIAFPDSLAPTGESNSNRNMGRIAADAAMLYLITGEQRYLSYAKDLLREITAYYQLRVDNNLNIEWYVFSQICVLCTYDWIYNDLSAEERLSYGKALYDAMCDIAWHGKGVRKQRFRENNGGYKSGLYGPPVLPWYIGLTFWKEGIDDEFCEKMICNGYDMHQKAIAFRAQMLGDKGGAATGVVGYCMGAYPYAEYDFYYTFRSAFGIDLAEKMNYMTGYLKYMDWIRLPGNKEYGFGDSFHLTNELPHAAMHSHINIIANMLGERYPEILPLASRLLKTYPSPPAQEMVPFIRMLNRLDPLECSGAEESAVTMPKAMYFDTMGQLYMRSGLDDDDTYVLFTTGGIPEQHKHYDNNNFVIYRNGYRALDSGTRPQPGWHLPYYYARTVAHNCVTIRMPGEKFPKYWSRGSSLEPKDMPMPNDGGQNHLLASQLVAFEETDDYVYIASDATKCYHEDKSELVMREFVWCVPDVFVVFDRVISDKAEYEKRWLYHTAAEPVMNGSMEFSETSQGGRSICRTLFPEDAQVQKIGGPGRQFWSDGRNWPIPKLTEEDYGYHVAIPSNEHPYVGQWRVEVLPGSAALADAFMHIIQVGDESLKKLPKTRTFRTDTVMGVEFRYAGKKYRISFDLAAPENHGCHIEIN